MGRVEVRSREGWMWSREVLYTHMKFSKDVWKLRLKNKKRSALVLREVLMRLRTAQGGQWRPLGKTAWPELGASEIGTTQGAMHREVWGWSLIQTHVEVTWTSRTKTKHSGAVEMSFLCTLDTELSSLHDPFTPPPCTTTEDRAVREQRPDIISMWACKSGTFTPGYTVPSCLATALLCWVWGCYTALPKNFAAWVLLVTFKQQKLKQTWETLNSDSWILLPSGQAHCENLCQARLEEDRDRGQFLPAPLCFWLEP